MMLKKRLQDQEFIEGADKQSNYLKLNQNKKYKYINHTTV